VAAAASRLHVQAEHPGSLVTLDKLSYEAGRMRPPPPRACQGNWVRLPLPANDDDLDSDLTTGALERGCSRGAFALAVGIFREHRTFAIEKPELRGWL
jgi:hypothetical protein